MVDAVRLQPQIIVKAEPGAGKTTRLPPALMEASGGKVLVLEPRRLAAKLSAERIAQTLGEPVGKRVGYVIRYDRQVSEETRLTFITEGIFLRLLQEDPLLREYEYIVLDEFHERSIHVDLALALTCLVQKKRPDLKLVVMSATLDTQALESYLPEASVFDIAGRTFPLTIEYMEPDPKVRPLLHLSQCVHKMVQDQRCQKNILVFLSGIGEILQLKSMLSGLKDFEVIPLASDISPKEQKRAFLTGGKRKIILSTNVAETSLTIPEVTGVIDNGLAKIAAQAPWSGMPTLDIKKISKASCIQRAGRAGRVTDGLVYRAYSESEFMSREPFSIPDIKRLDLCQFMLDVMDYGKKSDLPGDPFETISWFETPEEKQVELASHTLGFLGAIKEGGITELGSSLAKIPLHPRLALLVHHAQGNGCGPMGLLAACFIAEGMLLSRRSGPFEKARCDLSFQMEQLVRLERGEDLPSYGIEGAINQRARQRIVSSYNNLAGRLKISTKIRDILVDAKLLSKSLLAAYPDRVAKHRDLSQRKKSRNKQQDQRLYNFCMGRGGVLEESSPLENPEFLVAVEATERVTATNAARGTQIYVASQIDPEDLLEDPAGFVHRELVSEFRKGRDRMETLENVYYANIQVSERLIEISGEDASGILVELLRSNWPAPFEGKDDLLIYHRKVELLRESGLADDLPEFKGDLFTLLLHAICDDKQSLGEVASKSLHDYIWEQLSFEHQQLLAQLPNTVRLTNGSSVPVDYLHEGLPMIRVMIHELYGVEQPITLAQGRIGTVIEFLGPHRRPVQKTNSPKTFWDGTFKELRAQYLRRYPRHHWAENPGAAKPLMLKKHLVQS
jgi:ATP-dependent helicase HrpB